MKSPSLLLLALLFVGALSSARAADDQVGTLTFETNKIVFQTNSGSVVYSLEQSRFGKNLHSIPDAQMAKFEPKAVSKNGEDVDVSEVTMENTADGSTFVLVESVPLKVVHVLSGKVHTWKIVPETK